MPDNTKPTRENTYRQQILETLLYPVGWCEGKGRPTTIEQVSVALALESTFYYHKLQIAEIRLNEPNEISLRACYPGKIAELRGICFRVLIREDETCLVEVYLRSRDYVLQLRCSTLFERRELNLEPTGYLGLIHVQKLLEYFLDDYIPEIARQGLETKEEEGGALFYDHNLYLLEGWLFSTRDEHVPNIKDSNG